MPLDSFLDRDAIKKTFSGVKCMKQVHTLQVYSFFFADFSCHHSLISKKLGFVPEGRLFWFESVAHDSSCIQKRFGCVRLTCESSRVQPVIVGAQIGPITCNMAIRGLKESDVDC